MSNTQETFGTFRVIDAKRSDMINARSADGTHAVIMLSEIRDPPSPERRDAFARTSELLRGVTPTCDQLADTLDAGWQQDGTIWTAFEQHGPALIDLFEDEPVGADDVRSLLVDVLKGLRVLANTPGLDAHGQLEPHVIVRDSSDSRWMIRGVGWARHIDATPPMSFRKYAPPYEPGDDDSATGSSSDDLYSVGFCIYEYACGRRRFNEMFQLSAEIGPDAEHDIAARAELNRRWGQIHASGHRKRWERPSEVLDLPEDVAQTLDAMLRLRSDDDRGPASIEEALGLLGIHTEQTPAAPPEQAARRRDAARKEPSRASSSTEPTRDEDDAPDETARTALPFSESGPVRTAPLAMVALVLLLGVVAGGLFMMKSRSGSAGSGKVVVTASTQDPVEQGRDIVEVRVSMTGDVEDIALVGFQDQRNDELVLTLPASEIESIERFRAELPAADPGESIEYRVLAADEKKRILGSTEFVTFTEVAFATLTLRLPPDASDTQILCYRGKETKAHRIPIDEEGTSTLSLEHDTYFFVVEHPSYKVFEQVVEVDGDQELTFDLMPRPGGLRVSFVPTELVDSTEVRAVRVGGDEPVPDPVRNDQTLVFEDLIPGDFTVSVTSTSDGTTKSHSVTVASGETADLVVSPGAAADPVAQTERPIDVANLAWPLIPNDARRILALQPADFLDFLRTHSPLDTIEFTSINLPSGQPSGKVRVTGSFVDDDDAATFASRMAGLESRLSIEARVNARNVARHLEHRLDELGWNNPRVRLSSDDAAAYEDVRLIVETNAHDDEDREDLRDVLERFSFRADDKIRSLLY